MQALFVTAPGCHFCGDARLALAELAREFPLDVRELDAGSSDAADLIERHRPVMWPVVVIDGELFSVGRLPRTKLRRLLERRARAA